MRMRLVGVRDEEDDLLLLVDDILGICRLQ